MKQLWQHVNKTDGCWIWNGYINEKGYGRLRVRGKNIFAHRLSWILANGEIPNELCVCHKCDNPPCVRPEHLFLGTRADNYWDSFHKGRRAENPLPHVFGERQGLSKLTESEVLAIRNGDYSKIGSKVAMAQKYGIHKSNIGCILKRKTWKHI